MGRELINYEQAVARFPKGTLRRIKRALQNEETQADFFRAAIELLLSRRERKTKEKGK